MKANINYALILASGGIDSTACINFYKKLEFEIELLFIDYGQLSRKKEYLAIVSIANYYNVPINKIKISPNKQYNDGFILGRNAVLYFLALNNFKRTDGLIVTGVHAGTGYYDCSEEFSNQMQIIFDCYSNNTIKISTPFITFNKLDIKNYCQLESVPLHLTYSCELGKKQPCGICGTCKELISLNIKSD